MDAILSWRRLTTHCAWWPLQGFLDMDAYWLREARLGDENRFSRTDISIVRCEKKEGRSARSLIAKEYKSQTQSCDSGNRCTLWSPPFALLLHVAKWAACVKRAWSVIWAWPPHGRRSRICADWMRGSCK
jgi:hypothetical protein